MSLRKVQATGVFPNSGCGGDETTRVCSDGECEREAEEPELPAGSHLTAFSFTHSNNLNKQESSFYSQANLLEIEKKSEVVEQDLRSKIREILLKEAGIEQLEQQKKVLKDRRTSIAKENADLERRIREDEKKAWKALAQFSTYRKKMNDHRAAASQAEAQKVLEEKKAVIRKLKEKREELREDLENLTGSTVEEAKVEEVEKVVHV